MANPDEFPRLSDDALVRHIEISHARVGRKALEELVDRHGTAEVADMLGVYEERIEELMA